MALRVSRITGGGVRLYSVAAELDAAMFIMRIPHASIPSVQSGFARTAVRRALAPHWGALLALALFLVAGLAVLDDYGVAHDERRQREIAVANARYATGDRGALYGLGKADHLYGAAFEAPLLLVERTLRLEDSRGVHLARHLLTHLFFLAGGLFAYLLARRLFGARGLALFAMLFLLLHPRLYAHSFFNSKDIPFLALFIVALYLAHRAFRRDSAAAFLLLGAAAGALVNLRIAGVALVAAVLAARTLDFALARGWAERKRALLTTGVFAAGALLAVYASLPHLWADPVGRAAEWWSVSSTHPTITEELFRGTLYRSVDFPAEYVSVWLLLSSPPFVPLLGLVGTGAVLWRAGRAPRKAIGDTGLRFVLLALGCFALSLLGVIVLDVNIYNGWRLMHFLWAPLSLVAVFGLGWLARELRPARLRAAAHTAAGAGLAATAVSMALIHPNEQVYFNAFADRVVPEHLRTQYVMDHGGHPVRQALERLLDRHSGRVAAHGTGGTPEFLLEVNAEILPSEARGRLSKSPDIGGFGVTHGPGSGVGLAAAHVRVYGNTIVAAERKADPRAVYEATRGREPDLDAAFDVHRLDGALALVKEPCAPSLLTETTLILRAFPEDGDILPEWRRSKGFEVFHHLLAGYGTWFDGKCVAAIPLPDYPIAALEFGFSPEPPDDGAARDAARQAEADGLLLARAAYDLYLADGELAYIKEPCDPLDTEPVFHFDAFPIRASDLPQERRERGYERFHFRFYSNGALFDGACAAFFPLPDYPIAGVRTGQRAEYGDGDLWSASFSTNPEPHRAAYRAVEGSEPVARGAFDVHLADGALVYVKEPCAQADTEERFFLHVTPERAGDLPDARRELGFANLDFRFFLNGAWFDGKCAARVPLPAYSVASVRTGQRVSVDREIWSAEFAVP